MPCLWVKGMAAYDTVLEPDFYHLKEEFPHDRHYLERARLDGGAPYAVGIAAGRLRRRRHSHHCSRCSANQYGGIGPTDQHNRRGGYYANRDGGHYTNGER